MLLMRLVYHSLSQKHLLLLRVKKRFLESLQDTYILPQNNPDEKKKFTESAQQHQNLVNFPTGCFNTARVESMLFKSRALKGVLRNVRTQK